MDINEKFAFKGEHYYVNRFFEACDRNGNVLFHVNYAGSGIYHASRDAVYRVKEQLFHERLTLV